MELWRRWEGERPGWGHVAESAGMKVIDRHLEGRAGQSRNQLHSTCYLRSTELRISSRFDFFLNQCLLSLSGDNTEQVREVAVML